MLEIRGDATERERAMIEAHAPEGTVYVETEADGEYLNVRYHYVLHRPFERIRRITGYLVGSIDRFNDAKKAEVNDRVKHAVKGGE